MDPINFLVQACPSVGWFTGDQCNVCLVRLYHLMHEEPFMSAKDGLLDTSDTRNRLNIHDRETHVLFHFRYIMQV